MSEAGFSRTFQTIFLFAVILCLFSAEKVVSAEQVDQSNLQPWDGGWTHVNPDPNGQASMWQTFTPEGPSITAVEIDILTINPGRGDDILTVEIAKDGQILASAECSVNDGFDGLLRFEFAEAVAVMPGELYELKVLDTGKNLFGWKFASNTYEAGSRYVSANERRGSDWLFQTYSAAEPRIIYVDDDAAGANDGTSWENAYIYLQDALADANSAEKPVEILVAQGIYKPDQGANQSPGDREATFQLINSVTLKGGYTGIGVSDPNTRDMELYETILTGDLNGDDVKIVDVEHLQSEPTRAENSYHIVTSNGTDLTAVLEGFVITGGNADGSSPHPFGGGMHNENGSPTITYCSFSKNSAELGGAMYNEESLPVLTNCIFSINVAHPEFIRGSEMDIPGPGDGWYGGLGGAIYNQISSPLLTDCIFTRNSASKGGGIYNEESNGTMIECVFTGNGASYRASGWGAASGPYGGEGGGICNEKSDQVLANCMFTMNSALQGAALYNSFSNLIVNECKFTGNTAYVGFVFYVYRGCGGGMCNYNSSIAVQNSVFSGNLAEAYEDPDFYADGGAMYNYEGSTSTLTNCTLTGNSAQYASVISGDAVVNNCILWDNTVPQISGEVSITYSNVQDGWPGEDNIDVDPEFVRTGYWTEPSPRSPDSSVWIEGDYHLKSEAGRWDPVGESWITDNVTSPCIDAGDPNMSVGDEPEPNGGRINIGAYGGTAEASKSPAFSWFFETTQGPVPAKGLGIVLPHEHIFTDLRGPTTSGYGQADAEDVVRIMAPLLSDAREKGVGVFIECSSIGVGRNVSIINQVAEASGLPVVVPTGVYGRANFAPPEHRNMTEDELAALFISEIQEGIEGTSIKAGFIKIATDEGPMSTLLEKILRAAGRAASQTGAAIASHTPTGSNAVRQLDILESIDPAIRFIWVHAQNESNRSIHLQLAARGAYIEFDSLGWNPGQDLTYISAIKNLLTAGHGDRILLSHDAGWYQPGSANGGTQKPFTYLIDTFIPKLRDAGVEDATIRMITQTNPVRAFGFKSGE